ncbi:OmpA family protein [uncultured Kordia sp.]|uniref:OmpA family protein n=1 Tax=uncultured Kordia sp. TaxID=507699 RepID=UPI00261D3E1A|nr:OmpA family protein [uncultured Kordia sp.]
MISEETNQEVVSDELNPFSQHTKNIVFKSGTDELVENYTTEILTISEIIKKISGEYTVEISGHTDSVGNKGLNLVLSQKRAEKIKKLLVAQGCKSSRLIAKGYGETRPLASNKTKDGRKMNRRIEIIIIEN